MCQYDQQFSSLSFDMSWWQSNSTGFFFEDTIEAFIFSWLVVSLEIMNHMYSYQKLNKFLYFFTKKLLYRRNMQALKEVFSVVEIRVWNSIVKYRLSW